MNDMKPLANLFRAAVCAAWVAAAISTAAPANALALTQQSGGNYASCSNNYTYNSEIFTCADEGGPWSYRQTISLVSTACNEGGCDFNRGAVYTDFLYGPGRKIALQYYVCPSAIMNLYGFDTCAC
jgi:hypothetical protein